MGPLGLTGVVVFSADNVLINFIRPPIVQMDPKTMGVTAQVAQDLGLSDGQVIQAAVEVIDNKVRLVIKGFEIDAPTFKIDAPTFKTSAPTYKLDAPNWSVADLKSGTSIELKASLSTVGWTLTPTTSQFQSQTLTPGAEATSLDAADPLSLTNLAINQNASSAGVIPVWSSKLNSLFFEPAQFNVLFELLMPEVLSQASLDPLLQDWQKKWTANRLSMASLNPGALKNLVLSQSRSTENKIASALSSIGSALAGFRQLNGSNLNSTPEAPELSESVVEGSDPKSMLGTLAQLLSQITPTQENTKLIHQIKTATNELDSAQVHSVNLLMRGELAFHVVVPFMDADPVELYFKRRGKTSDDDSSNALTVDIHSKSRVLGEIWLNTSIVNSSQVDLVMWAVRPDIAELAKTNASELGHELMVSGLTLNSFQIFNAPKPIEQQTIPITGSILDAHA
jgi:hypothetical protein